MNEPVEFTTADGMNVRMDKDGENIRVKLSVDDGRDPVMFWLTGEEAQTFINGLVVANQAAMPVGAWTWHDGRPLHLPSYRVGYEAGAEEFEANG